MITYKATNTLNGKFYIGSTINFKRRKRDHLKGTENYPFQNALRKNPDAFIWEIYEDEYDKPILEQSLLDMWCGKEQCYNLNPFATRPPKIDPELNRKLASKKGRRLVDEKIGLFSRTKEEIVADAKKGRAALSQEMIIRGGKAAGKITSSQKWIDPEHLDLGTRSAATLVRMQIARGYPHESCNRKRIQ
jgi:group I intron endonuclease